MGDKNWTTLKLIPVECKLKERPGKKDLTGIERLRKFYGKDQVPKAYVACPTDALFDLQPGITAVPGWQVWSLEIH
jgi:hypothetical protein